MQLQDLVVTVSLLAAFNGGVEAWSPTNSYVPANVTCPNDINLLRNATGLSQSEIDWLKKERCEH